MQAESTEGAPINNVRPSREIAATILIATGCGLVYLLVAGGFRLDLKQSRSAHHILMADAMLHGQFEIRPSALQWKLEQLRAYAAADYDASHLWSLQNTVDPTDRDRIIRERANGELRYDWAIVGDRFYGYWGILTPALMMPFVAVWGPAASDRAINVLFGAINVGLFYWFLHRLHITGWCRTQRQLRLALTVLFAFGTSHFWMVERGDVWFAVQIVSLTALLSALIATCSKSERMGNWLICGCCFGAAFLGRSVIIAMGLFFVGILWMRCCRDAPGERWRPAWGRLVRGGLAFAIPVVAALGVQGWYNHARFGHYGENGLGIQIRTGGNPRFIEDYEKYGAFSPHYFSRNFKYYFWNYESLWNRYGLQSFDPQGNSVFLMTPPFLYVFVAWRRWRAFEFCVAAGVAPLVVLLLLFNGTGWVQFGPRYLLDATPLLLVLVAGGMRGRLTLPGYLLIILAVAMQVWGVSRMCAGQMEGLQAWVTQTNLVAAVVPLMFLGIIGWAWWGWFGNAGEDDPQGPLLFA